MKFISNLKNIALVLFLSIGAIACNDDYDVIIVETNTIADWL